MRKSIPSTNEARVSFAANQAGHANRLWLLFLTALCAGVGYAGTPAAATGGQTYRAMAPVAQYMMKQADEIALARSAAPKMISDDATVLVLGKKGYETAVKGSNGFSCFVGRSWANDFDATDFWDPRDLTPNCWNLAAVNSQLPEYLERTQWVLAGVSKDEMAARTKTAWASHKYTLPAPGTVAYMMSKSQCIHAPAPVQLVSACDVLQGHRRRTEVGGQPHGRAGCLGRQPHGPGHDLHGGGTHLVGRDARAVWSSRGT